MLIASIFFRISRSTNQVNTRVSTTLYTKLTGFYMYIKGYHIHDDLSS